MVYDFVLLALALISYGLGQNLICGGDFEQYIPTMKMVYNNGQYVQWTYISENSKCWYRYPSGFVEVQNQSYATFHTKNIQLNAVYDVYTLCQKVSVLVGSTYSLSLDVVKPMPVASATANLYMNGVKVGNVTSTDYLISQKIVYNFTAMTTIYQLCINGSFVPNSQTYKTIDDFSPLIDNVTLILIYTPPIIGNNQTQPINTSSTNTTTNTSITNPQTNISSNTSTTNSTNITNSTNQSLPTPPPQFIFDNSNISEITIYLQLTDHWQDGYILLSSTQPIIYDQYYYLKKYGTIFIEGQQQTNVIYSYDPSTNLLNVTIYILRDYDIKTIQVSFSIDFVINFKLKTKVIINGKDIYIYFIPQKMIKIVDTLDPISSTVIDGVTKIYSMLKFSFCTYFIMNLISFYTLTLMYNFLGLPAQPNFSRIALEKLSQIFYKRNSLFLYIQSTFGLSGFRQKFQFSHFVSDEQESVPLFLNDYSWFGKMGITSNFPANNLENIIMITFMAIKLLFLTLLQWTFPRFTYNIFGKLKNFVFVFIIQFLCVSPLMIVAAFTTILNSGFSTFNLKVNFLLHTGLLFFSIFSLSFYLLKIEKNRIQIKKSPKKTKVVLMKCVECLLNILLPILVTIGNQIAFFVLTTSYMILLVTVHIYSFFCYSILTRIFRTIMILFLIIHHFSFMFLYLTNILHEKLLIELKLAQPCKIAGLIVIFTVLFGGLIEILQFVVKLCYRIIKIMKKCCRCQKTNQKKIQTTKKVLQITQNKKHEVKNIQNQKKKNKEQLSYIIVQKLKKDKKKIPKLPNNRIAKEEMKIEQKIIKLENIKKIIKIKVQKNIKK